MELKRLLSPEDPLFTAAMDLYRASFPAHERRYPHAQRAVLAQPDYHFDLIVHHGRFTGLLLYWAAAEFLYVEHFCILPALRGGGCGAQALALLQQRGIPVILEIDPPEDEISLRRRDFYQRSGYCANPFPHAHPPYRTGNGAHRLVVMSCPDPLSARTYDSFARYLAGTVMADCPADEIC